MEWNCQWTEIILGIVIIIFAIWTITYSKYVVIISAVLLILHAMVCQNCRTCIPEVKTAKKTVKKRK